MDKYRSGCLALLFWLFSVPALAGVPCSVPFTLTNGTTADATQVMANYNAILTCLTNAAAAGSNSDITALNALVTPITPGSGGTNIFIATAPTGGSANAQVITTLVPSGFSASNNYGIITKIGITNTGPTTLTAPSTGAINVFKMANAGPTPLTGGELQTGDIAEFRFDGTQYQLMNPHVGQGAFVNTYSTIASASITDIASTGLHSVFVSGTTTITNFGNTLAGNAQFPFYFVEASAGPITITANNSNCSTTGGCIFTPGSVSFSLANFEVVLLEYTGQGSNLGTAAGNWKVDAIYRNASGVPRFISAPQIFGTPGTSTYTPTVGMLFDEVECIGAGGAGGGVNAAAAGWGGAQGGYAKGVFSAAVIGSSQSVTIGTGGTGVSGAAGNAGGNTTFGALLTANGGAGGKLGINPPSGSAAAGGSASGGYLNLTGAAGPPGLQVSGSYLQGGSGSPGLYGQGAVQGPFLTASGSTAGTNATTVGAGGSGAVDFTVSTAQAGGTGGNGICIVHEYIN